MKQLNFCIVLTLIFSFSLSILSAQQNNALVKNRSSQLSENSLTVAIPKKAASNDNFTDEWYNEAVNNLQQLEYNFYPQADQDHFKVANSKNHISFEMEPARYSVQNSIKGGTKSWKMNFELKGIGRNALSWTPDNNFSISNKQGTLAYQFNTVTVEYINNEEGLRQNFLVEKKLSGSGSLRVAMSVTGNLSATFNNNKLSFFEKNDTSIKLVYSDLKVFDANNNALPSYMEYDKATQELNLLVDDSKAAYPILIDPINMTPQWTASADGVLSGLLSPTQLNSTLFGFTVTSLGDVNGDGFGDAAISAPALADIFSGNGNLLEVGAVFVYYGSSSGLHTTPDNILQPNTAVAGALFGFSVAGGDITGDGKSDIIIGAPLDQFAVNVQTGWNNIGTVLVPIYVPVSGNVNVTAGKVYIYKGEDLTASNPSVFLQVKLSDNSFSPGILGILKKNTDIKSLFGFSVAATDDLNNDGKADLAVGVPSYLGTGLLDVQEGAAFVYFSNNLGTSTPVQLQVPSPSLLGLTSLPIVNSSALLYGFSVDGVGDYNNDGYADIVVGAPSGIDLSSLGGLLTGQTLGGSAYVYYGNASGIVSTIGARLQASPGGLAGNAANLFGYKVLGLKNIDGTRSGGIMIGAPTGGAISNLLSLTIKTGSAQVFFKQATSPGGIVTADQVLESPRSSGILALLNTMNLNILFGSSMDNAYDVNCDSYPDIVIGEPLSSGTNISQLQTNAVGGSAYVYYGTSGGGFNSTPVFTISTTYGGDILSVNTAALFGFSVAGVPKVQGAGSKPKIIAGTPGGALDFSSGLLNLGSTLSLLYNFAAGDNGIGKAYGFAPGFCGFLFTLPAESLNLSGRKNGTAINLNWLTGDESNISQYGIEKSSDGSYFTTLGYVNAKGDVNKNSYSIIDYHPSTINYYRARIIRKNDEYAYSPMVRISYDELSKDQISIAPNPVVSSYKIILTGIDPGAYIVEIKNTSGQTVQRKNINVTQNDYSEDMSRSNSMATGIYYLNVYNQNSKQIKVIKFMIK